MDRSRLRAVLDAKPFVPFTVHVVDGDLIGVRSPEFVWLPPAGKTFYIMSKLGDDGEMKILGLDYISHITFGPNADLEFPEKK
jgi:hypothetical protein